MGEKVRQGKVHEAEAKVDFKTSLDGYRAKVGEFRVIEIPHLRHLTIDGHGDPNTSSDYADALGALYPVAYKLKFASKRELGRDYVVPPLEALWWADDMNAFTSNRDKSKWNWKIMLLTPDWIDGEMVDAAVAEVAAKKSPRMLGQIRWEEVDEGTCMQTLHVGSYDAEGPVLEIMHNQEIPAAGFVMTGRHHEIYLNDPRRVTSERLRTILRQPITKATNGIEP